ncbi:hypothetical protein HMPREF0591_3270 [Mycobacterium parascrofulaceum ATCC BAA-614]|uniref:Uncharacterized protein n=1 Tax=Mycobacterium parascrofulaceum ATCC BAA-614 TaxID=525368 RepID=D5PAS6_9MYCO|nr:hypothetical protein HMPREF0591_3270 [Mycobacterium parascrofulaceum ATCC BAA-614]
MSLSPHRLLMSRVRFDGSDPGAGRVPPNGGTCVTLMRATV